MKAMATPMMYSIGSNTVKIVVTAVSHAVVFAPTICSMPIGVRTATIRKPTAANMILLTLGNFLVLPPMFVYDFNVGIVRVFNIFFTKLIEPQ